MLKQENASPLNYYESSYYPLPGLPGEVTCEVMIMDFHFISSPTSGSEFDGTNPILPFPHQLPKPNFILRESLPASPSGPHRFQLTTACARCLSILLVVLPLLSLLRSFLFSLFCCDARPVLFVQLSHSLFGHAGVGVGDERGTGEV
jgi:hypothetical protein